jgi:hypothetical protein
MKGFNEKEDWFSSDGDLLYRPVSTFGGTAS